MRIRDMRGRHAVHTQQRGFTNKKISHDPTGVDTGEVDPYLARDLALTKRMAEVLERHYPGHPWMVQVSHAQGIAYIKLPILMSRNQAYILHIDRMAMDPSLRCVMRAGGELLEKYQVPRTTFLLDHFLNAREAKRPKPRLIIPS